MHRKVLVYYHSKGEEDEIKTHNTPTNYLPRNNKLPDFRELVKMKNPLDLCCNCGNEPEI